MATLTKSIDGDVLVIELARASAGNALDRALQAELIDAWQKFEDDDALRVAVLRGSSEVFSIGHDVAELAADPARSPVPDDALFPLTLAKPVIAAIEGPCYGLGFELALACDLRVAGAGAKFGFADPNLFVPYRVASVLLPRMTFLGRGLELIFSGRILDMQQMADFGLLNRAAATGAAAATALATAKSMARRFPQARAFRKQDIWNLSGLPLPAAMRLARTPR